ncbi:ligand-binding domain of nuclear hormone receptor domain-containing protein [Ditylenchus destructor]|uniref:Ligand-binding domain of nuclear hormone receptor domain-containing protein n=1 Tax=Ditylenchus destructor TaxID=166010 RepID=A0AAD4QW31_9BILA|nr:ligand-binding domain of nuclear hormone receptor domain-containing protein [Ditylenchus destructor]
MQAVTNARSNSTAFVPPSTKCLVCGYPTNCCHYDALSCSGCKLFFRRSLLASKTLTCNLNEMCSKMNVWTDFSATFYKSMEKDVLLSLGRGFAYAQSYNRLSYTGPVFEETIEDKIIQSLIDVELKVRKIRESTRWPSKSVIFRSIRELLEPNRENELSHADQLMRTIEMARTLPVFSQLDYSDQEALLKQITLANTLLLQAFYSYQMKSETLVMPNGFSPTKPPNYLHDKDGMNGKSQIIDMMKHLSCRAMVPISRIELTMEEFVLLKAIIYSHSAIHGLSERGRVLLEEESVRYSKTLMKHLQSHVGAAPGAKKYAEIVSFVGCLFHASQQLREIHVYVETVFRPSFCHPPFMETIMYA